MVATPVAVEIAAAIVEEAAVAVMTAEVAASVEAVASVVEEEEDSPVAAEEALAIPLCRRTDSNLRTRLPSKSEVCRTR